jgi:hypothetical protein
MRFEPIDDPRTPVPQLFMDTLASASDPAIRSLRQRRPSMTCLPYTRMRISRSRRYEHWKRK